MTKKTTLVPSKDQTPTQGEGAKKGVLATILWSAGAFVVGVAVFLGAAVLLKPAAPAANVIAAETTTPAPEASASATPTPALSKASAGADDQGAAACAVLSSTIPNVTEDNRLDVADQLTAGAGTTDVEPLHSQMLQIASAYQQSLSVDSSTVDALNSTYSYCVSIGAFSG